MRGILPDEWFVRRDGVPLTKGPVRAAVLGLLAPLQDSSVLDVGCGTGGMTVELARCGARVTAIEKNPAALETARENARRAGVASCIDYIEGEAPASFAGLGLFDAVFVGGHGKELTVLLTACLYRMQPGGRLVLPAILPETALGAFRFFDDRGIETRGWQLFPAEAKRMGSSWMFAGMNPVYLVWADREAEA